MAYECAPEAELSWLPSLGAPEHQNHGVTTQEHLADEAILVHRLCFLLAAMRNLCPHLTHILQDHVGVPVKSLDSSKDLPIVPAVDEHLRVVLHALLQD